MPLFTPKKPMQFLDGSEHQGNPGKTSKFINDWMRTIFQVSGVHCHVYRMEGTFEQERDPIGVKHDRSGTAELATDIGSFMGIQDPILGENRDRAYNFDEVPIVKGVYLISTSELELMRFGFKSNETITMEFHERDVVEKLGRRFIIGDVIELPHLRDVSDDGRVANKWYEVRNVSWSPGGYDIQYYRHVLAVVLEPIRHQQEFLDLYENVRDQYGKTLEEQSSNKEHALNLTAEIQSIADSTARTTLFDMVPLYYDPNDPDLKPDLYTDDLIPPGLLPVDQGPSFPPNPVEGCWFVRTDIYPNRLYRYLNGAWRMIEKDEKREWQPYNWIVEWREHMSDGSEEDRDRGWDLRSVHDVATDREERSDPSK